MTSVAPNTRVSSPEQIGVAALVGGPLAGAILLKENYRVLGNQPPSAMPLAWALAITFALVSLGLRGRSLGSPSLFALFALGSWRYANHLQGAALKERLTAEAHRRTWLRTLSVAGGTLAATIVVVLLLEFGLTFFADLPDASN